MSSEPAALNADAVLACAADAIVVVDAELRVTGWNPAAERLFGWRAEEVMGEPVPIVPEELTAEHHAVLERVRAGGPLSIVSRRMRRDGQVVDVRVDTNGLFDAAGRPIGWVSVFHTYEDAGALQSHMAERARLVRRLTDVVADVNADLDLSAVLDRIAHSLTELTGADAGGFVLIEDDRLRLVSLTQLSDHLRGYSASLESSLFGELLRSGKTVLLATDDTRSLGDLIWADLDGLHTIALGVSNVQGRPYGALYALYSRRKVGHIELELLELLAAHAGVALGNAMAYQEMVRQRAHEHAVVDASADGIAVLDRAGRVRKWNRSAAELTGRAFGDVVGRPPPFPLPREQGEPIKHLLDNGCWLEILIADIPGTEERVVDFRDVTQAKALEEEKDLFLATASHELRTPITVVQGFANTLVQRWEKLDDAARRSAVTTIAERSATLAHLVENLGLGSRAGSGDLAVSNAPFDLRKLLKSTTAAFRPLSGRHGLTLALPECLPEVVGDPVATDVIVGQLLENAFKYSPDGGSVVVRAEVRRDRVVVAVEDEGIGIASGDEERIFERFVQGEAGDRRRFGGIGLGLYIARRLARVQGGDVTAHPNDPSGTRMRFTLQRAGNRGPGSGAESSIPVADDTEDGAAP
ncbi:PAS domain S-box-containing protein [Spinactinospora alkalitolerans]|uniref:histidine kinase n=1 Tax=Spinactinospora alkalitolerans TaxID=687207 RepID=A0A852U5C5_9ACTN|nr:PAS domain-containing protein [Spinactinospora alkalitolerans]NYE50817.1 PAS domain S-box-containing protein [Spinactinospora alkalitolerans]